MVKHQHLSAQEVFCLIKSQLITVAGNNRLKIYGRLDCASGQRMKKENRVFFKTEMEAALYGFRPCGHCMISAYREWKQIGIKITKPGGTA